MTERPTPAVDPHAVPLAEHGILDTIARYAHHVDDGEFEALSRLFTADGEFTIDRFDEPLNPLRGRRQIVEYLARSAEERSRDPLRGPYRRHHVSSTLIDVETSTRARATSYFVAVMVHGVDHWGRYVDAFELDDGRWRFANRHVHVDGRIRRASS